MDSSFSVIFGLPGQGMLLHLDPVALFFAALLLPQVIASALAGMRASFGFWLFVAGLLLILFAATPFALVFGVGMMGAASLCLAVQFATRWIALYACVAFFAVICLIPALSLPACSLGFVLVLLAISALVGLVPFYNWVPRVYAALPAPMSAFMSGAVVNVSFYILIRYVFMNASMVQKPWWGALLMLLGGLSALFGALRAVISVELRDLLAWSTITIVGFIAIGFGVAVQAGLSGHPALAGLALQAMLLWLLAHGLFKPLLLIGAGEIQNAVGTTSLNWLGGLMRGMPRLGVLMLLGAAGLAIVPLGPAFAPAFLLIQAVIGAAFAGGVIAWCGSALLLVVLGLGATLLLLAAVKLIGLGFLGRPRSLHAAAAEESRSGPFWGMVVLFAFAVPLTLVPGFMLFLCAPVISIILPLARTSALAYTPLTLCLLAGVALLATGFVQARWGMRGLRETSSWNGGFGRPPVWLPFGDPHTQPSASGLVEPLREVFGQTIMIDPVARYLWPAIRRAYVWVVRFVQRSRGFSARLWLAIMFSALMLALLVFGLMQGS